MAENDSRKSKTATLSDLLEGPFDVVVYGELFEGLKVNHSRLSDRLKNRIEHICKENDIGLYPSDQTQIAAVSSQG